MGRPIPPLQPIILDTEIEVDWNHRSQLDEIDRLKWRANLEAAGIVLAVLAAILLVM